MDINIWPCLSRNKLIIIIGIVFALALLNACGGGGGGGSDGGIIYTGNTNPAIITTTNAARLVANVMGDSATATAITASRVTENAPSQRTGLAHLARRLSLHLRETLMQTVAARSAVLHTAAKIEVNETDPCDSGSVQITGTLNDDGTGTLTAIFSSCRYGNETISGQATLRIDAFDLSFFILTDATFSFSTLTLTTPDLSAGLSGSIRSQVTIGTNTERLIINMVTRNNTSDHMTKTE